MKLENYKNHILVTVDNINDLDELVNLLDNNDSQKTSVIINFLHCNIGHNLIVDRLLPFHFICIGHVKSYLK